MATRDPWAVMDGATRKVDAEDARVAIGALWTPGATAITARQGLRPGPGSPGLVAQTGTPGPNVTVNAVQYTMTASRGAGPYIGTETAQVTIPILDVPADPSNQRNDLIIIRQSDTYYSDGSTVGGPIRVQGTPSGTPADPSLAAYPDHIQLARIRVTAGAATVTTSMIDDLRPGWVVALGGTLPIRTQAERDALTGWDGAVIYRMDRDWVEIHDGTAWRVQGVAICASVADRDTAITSPKSGLLAFTTDADVLWQYDGATSAWLEYPAPPSAMLRQTVVQSMDNAVFEAVTFDAEDWDTNSGHSTSVNTSRFTAPRAGKYRLSGGVGFAVNSSGSRGAVWLKNGSHINGSQVMGPNNGAVLTSLITARTITVQLAVGDYVELAGYQNSGGALNSTVSSSDQSYMSVDYVRS